MTKPVTGLLGGAQAAITTTPVAVDLRALAGRSVFVWSDDADLWFCFGDGTSTTLLTSGAEAASLTSLKADRVAKGSKAARIVSNGVGYLIVRAVSGSGTVHVKVASELNGALGDAEQASPETTTVSGTVALTSTQLPAALGPQAHALSLSTVPGITRTNNDTYLVNQSMAADVLGPSITVGPRGRLKLDIDWTAASTQIGTHMLQALRNDGTTWDDLSESTAAFATHPNNNTASITAHFKDLEVFATVRYRYARTSGGAAGNNLNVKTTVV